MDCTHPSFRAAYTAWHRRHAEQTLHWLDRWRAELRISGETTISTTGPQTPYR
ncbi:hypothetical protein [Streptomyces sp. NPDC091217]|uniref:hypothetical protein n=1 Tax=Streptomyces sp. NPDC091217 TaxID=3365975 RepID=UPI003809EB57